MVDKWLTYQPHRIMEIDNPFGQVVYGKWENYAKPRLISIGSLLGLRLGKRHTYYCVDAINGDDDNHTGRSPSQAWKTIAKVNSFVFNPGAHILFKGGDVFAGRLIPTYSGTADLPIIYEDYGSGDRPIINGSAINALYISEASGIQNLRFENIDFAGATGVDSDTVHVDSHYLYFYNCIFRDSAGGKGFGASSNDGTTIHHLTLDTCEAYGNNKSGIYIGSETGANGPHDCLIVNCPSHNNGTHAYADHGIYVRFGVTVRDCITSGNFYAGLKTNCQGHHNMPFSPIVENCISHSNQIGGVCDNDHSIWRNNLIYGNVVGGVTIGEPNNEFYFNTFVNNGASYGELRFEFVTTGHIINNNLFVADKAFNYYQNCLFSSDPITLDAIQAGSTFDYNAYYRDGSDSTGIAITYNTNTYTFAQWQALSNSPDAHSTLLTEPPDISYRYTDFHAATGGNLAGLGIIIAGCELDKDGVTRADPPAPGCYEAVSVDNNPFGSSWLFNGATDRIDWASIFNPTGQPITISLWFKSTDVSALHYLMAIYETGDAAYGLGCYMPLDLFSFARNGTTDLYRQTNSPLYMEGLWTHFLVTHDGVMTTAASVHIYKNGTEVVSYDSSINGATEGVNGGSWSIGGLLYNDLYNFHGNLCQLAVWNRELTAPEITALASGISADTYPTDLEFYWKGDMNDLHDSITNTLGVADGATYEHGDGPIITYP